MFQHLLDFHVKNVGKYTVRPMDAVIGFSQKKHSIPKGFRSLPTQNARVYQHLPY